ncbi:MAG: response regulator transcription factor [Lachnospiraceae bacterium]
MALIYIVEDDESIQEIETVALKSSGHEVVAFGNAAAFYKKLETILPDLILLDVMLPDEDGNDIIKKLRSRAETKKLPVIMVTAKTSEMDLVRGIENGADDYLKKPFSVMELISRVKALLRRTAGEKEKVLKLYEIEINNIRHSCSVSGEEIALTYKEHELLKYLIINKGNVLSRDRIMEHVWGTDYEGESRTVDMHIKTLRQKLKGAGEHIKTVRNVGYLID